MSWTRTLPVVAATALVVVLLAGCTAPAAPSPSPSATQPFALAIDPDAVLEALGPVPPHVELTTAIVNNYLQRSADRQWATVVLSYPNAVRPEVAEVTRVVGANDGLPGCLAAATGTPQEISVAGYVCSVQYPSAPSGVLSDAQAGYRYDYWTQFVVPCQSDAGYSDRSTPSSRGDFVADWPFENWHPQPQGDDGLITGLEFDQLDLVCPTIPDELNG